MSIQIGEKVVDVRDLLLTNLLTTSKYDLLIDQFIELDVREMVLPDVQPHTAYTSIKNRLYLRDLFGIVHVACKDKKIILRNLAFTFPEIYHKKGHPRSNTSTYDRIIDSTLKKPINVLQVENKSPLTVCISIRNRIRSRGIDNVTVIRRGNIIYIINENITDIETL